MANPALNSLIITVLMLGIGYIFRQVLILKPEVAWLESFQTNRPASDAVAEPVLLAPMARMLGERKGKLSLSALSMRSLLDGIDARLDETREISRYLIGLLIFLGLLGTFWGLLGTVSAVGDVIGSLSVEGGDIGMMFGNLQQGLQAPLTGMGTAFSSSLFGLAGSLVLGFLELQASQAQNRFYTDSGRLAVGRHAAVQRCRLWRKRAVGPGLSPGLAGTDRRKPGNPSAHGGAFGRRTPLRQPEPAGAD